MTLTARTLRKVMPGLSRADAKRYLPDVLQAMHLAECTTQMRSRAFLATLGVESGSLRYRHEIDPGYQYEGRADLGNTHRGDGHRFAGEGWIQVTGRTNVTKLSHWVYRHGLTKTPMYLLFHPNQIGDRFPGVSAAWFWLGAHPRHGYTHLNQAADAGSMVTVREMVNGGTNGLDDFLHRVSLCRQLGAKILPGPSGKTKFRQKRAAKHTAHLASPAQVQAINLSTKANWGNYDPSSYGWPHAVPDLVPLVVLGVNFGHCARAVHALMVDLITELAGEIPGGLDPKSCWAYSTTDDLPDGSWSFHRYGLADDVDWVDNPMGTYLVNPDTGQRYAIPYDVATRIARKYGFEWGGNWSGGKGRTGFKDYMHFECHLSPHDAAAYVPGSLLASTTPPDLLEEIMSLYDGHKLTKTEQATRDRFESRVANAVWAKPMRSPLSRKRFPMWRFVQSIYRREMSGK